jgi:hypothetical protein
MAIQQRSLRRVQWEAQLEKLCPTKITLVRANPYTCPAHVGSRTSIALACPTCNGTGYAGLARGANLNAAPAATIYFIYGDVQSGHGLYGNGGDFVRVLADLGKQEIGDATMFCKVDDVDARTGKLIHPDTDPTYPRPDRIIDRFGVLYTVAKSLLGNFGDDAVYRNCALLLGEQGAAK